MATFLAHNGDMPGMPAPVKDERGCLLAFLEQQRLTMRLTAHGLTDAQARMAPTHSALTVGGLIKHVSAVEEMWIGMVAGRGYADSDYEGNFNLGPDETLAGAIARYEAVGSATASAVASIDLDAPVPVPPGVPWFPDDVDAWSVRWVLLHVIEETARHVGHADIIREHIDGATALPLMAAAEGWPATPWLQPWSLPSHS